MLICVNNSSEGYKTPCPHESADAPAHKRIHNFQQTGSIGTGGACESAAHGQPFSYAADAPQDRKRAFVRQTQRTTGPRGQPTHGSP